MATTNQATPEYIPFTNRYIMYKLLNYGKSYTNYTKYTMIDNSDNIETIYVDNASCTNDKTLNVQPENMYYYVEIHYTAFTDKKKLETIMKAIEIDTLIGKYGCKE